MKSQRETDNSDQKTSARARRFLDDQGIDVAAIIRREDAARMMVLFSVQEQELAQQMGVGRRVMRRRREALRKLAES